MKSVSFIKFGSAVMLDGKSVTSYGADGIRPSRTNAVTMSYDGSNYLFEYKTKRGTETVIVHPTNVQFARFAAEENEDTKAKSTGRRTRTEA
jgi:hypothetical protein